MVAGEDEVAGLLLELQAADDPEDVLQRVKITIVWTPALAESDAGKALFTAITSLPASEAKEATKVAHYDQLRNAEYDEVMERWWSCPPVPADAEDVLELIFVDLTPGDERWEPEKVACAASEPFGDAAQRFRVQANKKHRHPWLPSMHYTLLLDERGSRGVMFYSLADRTVAEVLTDLKDDRQLHYTRDDDSRAHREEAAKSPARVFSLWDPPRTLPPWCTTPDSWIEPTPPPGFSAPKEEGAQLYIAVPTLHVPAVGIVPSATKPQVIARTLYWPVTRSGSYTFGFHVDCEEDYVPSSERLTPATLTAENAQALLGRYVQTSTVPDPPRDDAPPDSKKRKNVPINKYATRKVAIAWGLALDDDGRPDWLHCYSLGSTLAIDLKGLERPFGRPNVRTSNCAWIAAVMLDADKRALGVQAEPAEDVFGPWVQQTERWIKQLNAAGVDKLVEVGQEGTFVAGDIEQSKADTDDWEAYIAGAKPGLWRMSVAESDVVYFTWVREGTLDYDALPQLSGRPALGDHDGEWHEVGSYSSDSSFVGLFSKSALDALLGEGLKQEKIETLVDAMNMEGLGEYMPGGIFSGMMVDTLSKE
ncbi:hypothetical protein AURDEDRAFT_162626 [Auricularia subglabra TFB-10046 SS5]|nr:hypothetical protein AURDEDRAFT_162626 [Auricularia subglabra TFB-10046 SS5]